MSDRYNTYLYEFFVSTKFVNKFTAIFANIEITSDRVVTLA